MQNSGQPEPTCLSLSTGVLRSCNGRGGNVALAISHLSLAPLDTLPGQLPRQFESFGESPAIALSVRHVFTPEEPLTLSVPLAARPIKTMDYQFGGAERNTLPATDAIATRPAAPLRRAASRTRVRPSADVVKLQDRLQLLLQPPLEAILKSRHLRMPFEPFAFQWDGVAFLYPRHQAVLADEMGLGKSMQAITAIRLLAHQGQLRRVLLVCPKPLLANWQNEFAMWAPELPIAVIEGTPGRRTWIWQHSAPLVTLANYESLLRDSDLACSAQRPFDLVVLDEAQRIKNYDGATSQIVRCLPRERSWALTGTPIENSTDDLRGIFGFVAPGRVHRSMMPRLVARSVSDYVLRRTKEQVLRDLPPKIYRDAELPLTPQQSAAYQLAEGRGVVRLNELGGELTIQHVFELVLRLKQICNFDPATGASSKLERLEADLEECAASGRKAIVFSQWVQTIQVLKRRLARFGPLEYHGQVPHKHRQHTIEHFRTHPEHQVLLMSYGAGSVGLNLQFAGYVFLFDRWWNPAVEDQAIHRAHRIGSQGPVTVTRFLSLGTIEERIEEILARKRELFSTVFGGPLSAPRGGLSRAEIMSLFKLESS